ncbi:glycosyltransferase family 39 protein [Roseibium sp.]|uniref:glycosyltransferase family 39 protein n=1 Tax=Roseibium sp. TaxID=1936156 RepID=UPI003A978E7C
MTPQTAQRSALIYVLGLCALWALIPTLTFPNPPLDVVEGFAWGRELALGYTKHPPMQAWLLEFTYRLTGGSTFGGYWLSQIAIGLGYLCIWHLGRRLGLSERQSFWSIVLTSATFYFTLPAPEFNPNILQIPVWTALILFFHRGITNRKLSDWILLGIIAAFGLYTKYFVALIIGAIGLYALSFPHARRSLATPGPWVAMAVCMILLTPHLMWLSETDFLTLKYAASRSHAAPEWTAHLRNPVAFLGAQIGNHAGLFIVVLAGFGLTGLKRIRARVAPTSAPENSQAATFLAWFAFIPLGVVLLASAVTGNEFEHMWGTPLFVLSGVTAVHFLTLPAIWSHPRRALIAAVTIQAIFLAVILGQAILEPLWKTKYTRLHYPGRAIADRLAEEWEKKTGMPLAYVAGDMWSTANVTLHADARPHMFYLHDPILCPWIDLKDVQKSGVMLVWRGQSETPPAELLVYYPDAKRDGFFSIASHDYGSIPDVTVNWMIVAPGDVSEQKFLRP